ncbi:MAG: hypothetical protein N0E48_03760, partial [Candidatus Thiodiazotropha endolucinida]|nr:hypothetical protein [Candidatus Thiodiazotropha taylori]MCW4342475.1 hypothetical protein [Candidatus Thiodiazotropha endolucinida]
CYSVPGPRFIAALRVWISRFEAVAKRRNWTDNTKLDNLLPRLQGRAGDFVFNQLPEETISCYSELVKELNSRFRIIETEKTFAAKFSQRVQKHDETVEEFAAELKRLYSKAYKYRDNKTRQEDLVRRLLDGLKDGEARFEVEYNKEPEDIDQAVYHAVNFIQTRRRSRPDAYTERKFKKFARRTSQESDAEDSEVEQMEGTEDYEYALRLPSKGDTYVKKKPMKNEQKIEANNGNGSTQTDAMTDVKSMVKALAGQVAELQKGMLNAKPQQQGSPITGSNGVLCYACNFRGHLARNCPNKSRVQRQRNNGNVQIPYQGKAEVRQEGCLNSNSLN